MSTSQTYRANCHCAAVRYTAEVSPPLEQGHQIVSCNCSICVRDGKLNIYILRDKINFVQGEDKLKEYEYLTLTHAFCGVCGTAMYVRMTDPTHEFANELALNVRAFHDLDWSKLTIKEVDMKDHGPAYHPY